MKSFRGHIEEARKSKKATPADVANETPGQGDAAPEQKATKIKRNLGIEYQSKLANMVVKALSSEECYGIRTTKSGEPNAGDLTVNLSASGETLKIECKFGQAQGPSIGLDYENGAWTGVGSGIGGLSLTTVVKTIDGKSVPVPNFITNSQSPERKAMAEMLNQAMEQLVLKKAMRTGRIIKTYAHYRQQGGSIIEGVSRHLSIPFKTNAECYKSIKVLLEQEMRSMKDSDRRPLRGKLYWAAFEGGMEAQGDHMVHLSEQGLYRVGSDLPKFASGLSSVVSTLVEAASDSRMEQMGMVEWRFKPSGFTVPSARARAHVERNRWIIAEGKGTQLHVKGLSRGMGGYTPFVVETAVRKDGQPSVKAVKLPAQYYLSESVTKDDYIGRVVKVHEKVETDKGTAMRCDIAHSMSEITAPLVVRVEPKMNKLLAKSINLETESGAKAFADALKRCIT